MRPGISAPGRQNETFEVQVALPGIKLLLADTGGAPRARSW
jgi:hypothetical protein